MIHGFKSGVAQGCPLSPLLFLLVGQALADAITASKHRGIQVGSYEYRLSQFADDTALFLSSFEDIKRAMRAIRGWGRATGMKENAKKREILAMGKLRGTTDQSIPGKWIKEGEWAICLGVPVGNDLDHGKWWDKKIQATRDIANARARNPEGKNSRR